ncbi:MAG: glycosyltransferase [Candidatus Omnitrophota bacterium]
MNRVFFVANNNIGDSGLSGGDRIFIELARGWKDKTEVCLAGCEEAITVCKREGLNDIRFFQSCRKLGLKNVYTLSAIFRNFFKKLFFGCLFVLKERKLIRDFSHVYSVSDFYPDSIPAFIIKLLNPNIIWIAGFYLIAPRPWAADNPYKGKDFFRGVLYWLSQRPIYWIINNYADFVFVTSEPDRGVFINQRRPSEKVLAIRGGVDVSAANIYLSSPEAIVVSQRKYDACFLGRFHLQKGVLAIIDIWKLVVESLPNAMLAMIGNGPLEAQVSQKLKEYGLEKNVYLFGFLNGEEKFNIFKLSKIVVHPATFDSGGMSAAEAMAWGLPGVSFDLESLKTYYPQGMVKVPMFNQKKFSQEIIRLLTDENHYAQNSIAARDLILKQWDWKNQAESIFKQVFLSQDYKE